MSMINLENLFSIYRYLVWSAADLVECFYFPSVLSLYVQCLCFSHACLNVYEICTEFFSGSVSSEGVSGNGSSFVRPSEPFPAAFRPSGTGRTGSTDTGDGFSPKWCTGCRTCSWRWERGRIGVRAWKQNLGLNRVTRLADFFSLIGLLLRAHCDFRKDEAAQKLQYLGATFDYRTFYIFTQTSCLWMWFVVGISRFQKCSDSLFGVWCFGLTNWY